MSLPLNAAMMGIAIFGPEIPRAIPGRAPGHRYRVMFLHTKTKIPFVRAPNLECSLVRIFANENKDSFRKGSQSGVFSKRKAIGG